MTVITSREFNQRTNEAQKAAKIAPVIITNRGEQEWVLMSYHDYAQLTALSKPKTLLDIAIQGTPEVADIDFELPPRSPYQRKMVEF